MAKRVLVYVIAVALAFMSIITFSTIASAVWPFGEKKINCCIKKWVGQNQCTQMTKEECDKAGGKPVNKCEECK